jgi:hypothetical protein
VKYSAEALAKNQNVPGEYWIPAAELEEFNKNIIGPIEVVAEFRAD